MLVHVITLLLHVIALLQRVTRDSNITVFCHNSSVIVECRLTS